MKIKYCLVYCILYLAINSKAQISNDLLIGNKQLHFINYWSKNIGKSETLNIFNLNSIAIDYRTKEFTNYSVDVQLSYQFKKWIGIALGLAYENASLLPSIGFNLSYLSKKGKFYIEAYPVISIRKKIQPSITALVGFNPLLYKNWHLINQAILTQDSEGRNLILRIGIGYKEKITWGIGVDNYHYSDFQYTNQGIFLRYVL